MDLQFLLFYGLFGVWVVERLYSIGTAVPGLNRHKWDYYAVRFSKISWSKESPQEKFNSEYIEPFFVHCLIVYVFHVWDSKRIQQIVAVFACKK